MITYGNTGYTYRYSTGRSELAVGSSGSFASTGFREYAIRAYIESGMIYRLSPTSKFSRTMKSKSKGQGSFSLNSVDLTLSQTNNSGLFQTERVCRQQFQI